MILSAAILFATQINAQDIIRDRRIEQQRRTSQVMSVDERVKRMDEVLKLTDKQKSDLVEYFAEVNEQRTKSLEGVDANRSTRRAAAENRRLTHNAKLKEILGNEKYDLWMKSPQNNLLRNSEVRNTRQFTRKGNTSGRAIKNRTPLASQEQAKKLKEKLNLSDSQEKDLINYFDNVKKERDARSAEAQKNRNERRLEMEKIREQKLEELKKILGEEKYNDLQEIQKSQRQNKRR